MLDVCDPETRKNCSSLKESLMDIDSNFDDDYNTVNDLKKKKEKKQPEIISKKKVRFELSDDLSNANTFNYEHDNESVSDEDILDDELEDESISGEETLDEECDDESMPNVEHFDNDNVDTFDYNHEEEFDYDDEKEETFSDSEPNDEDLSDNNNDIKPISMKEDIYGRIRKPDGTIVASYLN